jgi:hypothetical protein
MVPKWTCGLVFAAMITSPNRGQSCEVFGAQAGNAARCVKHPQQWHSLSAGRNRMCASCPEDAA